MAFFDDLDKIDGLIAEANEAGDSGVNTTNDFLVGQRAQWTVITVSPVRPLGRGEALRLAAWDDEAPWLPELPPRPWPAS